ncbi:cell division protein FtsQ [Weissella uvarum]|uniref:cell division protein FtsQ/DivIB n=1 Tax=Weissella uvarum TaxID=1479233 RepID=UPI00195F4EDE|nr:cell division protein FtsQ/DivIB [Weissella uvarum]MBM7617790.1 cell division protein FtsQ [Weissella uvarum]MCM0595831.1 cell division protein FtsQ/DivIB [Weissella uvarum]
MADDDSKNQSTSDIQKHLNQLIDEESTSAHATSSQAKQGKKDATTQNKASKKPKTPRPPRQKKNRRSFNLSFRTFWQALVAKAPQKSTDAEEVDAFLPDEYHDDEGLDEVALNIPATGDAWKRQRKQGMIVIGILVVALLGVGWFNSPFAQVQHYQVVGHDDLKKKDILAAATLKKQQSTFLTYEEQAFFKKQAQQHNPQISDLTLTMKNPTTLVVHIKERHQVGYLKNDDGYQKILEDGTILATNLKHHPADSYPIYDDFPNNKTLEQVTERFGKLSGPVRRSVSDVVWSPTKLNSDRLILYMNDGNEVLVSAGDLDRKLKYYPSIVAQYQQSHPDKANKKTIIDLQVGAYGYQQTF